MRSVGGTFIALAMLLTVTACGPNEQDIQATVTAEIATAVAQIPTPVPTATAISTPTPQPTAIPIPTPTPQPTPTTLPLRIADGVVVGGQAKTPPEIYATVSPSVICIGEGGGCIGTAWVIEPDLAITAAHVVGSRTTVSLYTAAAGPFVATVVGIDKGHDVALLGFSSTLIDPPSLLTHSLPLSERGSSLYAFGKGGSGATQGGAGGALVRSGVFSQVTGFGDPAGGNITVNLTSTPGDMGGPLVDSYGRVVGMIRSMDINGVYSYAVPMNTILASLPRLKRGERF